MTNIISRLALPALALLLAVFGERPTYGEERAETCYAIAAAGQESEGSCPRCAGGHVDVIGSLNSQGMLVCGRNLTACVIDDPKTHKCSAKLVTEGAKADGKCLAVATREAGATAICLVDP